MAENDSARGPPQALPESRPMCQALALLDRLTLELDPFPIPVILQPVAAYLASEFYDPEAIRRAIRHLSMFGSAECCPFIDPEDRSAVEELLPMAPAAAWEALEDHVWTTAGHPILD